MSYDCREPNRVLTLQIGDMANEQVFFSGGLCASWGM